jgi:hypothetical protein
MDWKLHIFSEMTPIQEFVYTQVNDEARADRRMSIGACLSAAAVHLKYEYHFNLWEMIGTLLHVSYCTCTDLIHLSPQVSQPHAVRSKFCGLGRLLMAMPCYWGEAHRWLRYGISIYLIHQLIRPINRTGNPCQNCVRTMTGCSRFTGCIIWT